MENRVSNLSQVFAPGTAYYYGFPTEWDSGFYNACPPEIEELVAMRPAVSAGPNVNVVTFANTVAQDTWTILQDELGVPLASRKQIITLPAHIDCAMKGRTRNEEIKRALADSIPDRGLVMAQPYVDDRLEAKYRIQPSVTGWLNDKNNIRSFVPEQYRVPELARVQNGREFAGIDAEKLPYPCVVKVSSSSAGDGVKICRSKEEFRSAQDKFKDSDCTILVQKYIDLSSEVDLKFVVHEDQNKPFELLGYSNEITGLNGEYLGGIIRSDADSVATVQNIYKILSTKILPKFKQKGWFGVGGVDVLVDQDGNFYFSDFNCRMTATMAQTMQSNAGLFKDNSVLVFNGKFQGSLGNFLEKVGPLATNGNPQQSLNVVALAKGNGDVKMHAGVIFDQKESLRGNIIELQRLGIRSDIFAHLEF